jgi:hypothetical protein
VARLPGDELLEGADSVSTRAIGIDAPAAAVWPWLAQMGPSPRGGAYTYDWIENLLGLDMHSADRVLPEFQDPEVGEVLNFGRNGMRLERVEFEHVLAWRSEDRNWVWTFVLEQCGAGTRLISRNRFRLPTMAARIGMLPMVPGSLVMERKMLLGIKQRAEGLALAGPGAPSTSGSTRPHKPFSARLLGLTAVALSALYLVSDVIEGIQGGFSGGQLGLTLVAEAAIPIFVIGLYHAQRPQISRLGQVSAIAYAYSFVFFTGTVVYALIQRTDNYNALGNDLSPWMTVHGVVMVFAGLGFGYAVVAARVLPRWTGVALGSGVVLVAVSQGAPEGVQLLAAGIRDLAFAGMGMALLRSDQSTARAPRFIGAPPPAVLSSSLRPSPVPGGSGPED